MRVLLVAVVALLMAAACSAGPTVANAGGDRWCYNSGLDNGVNCSQPSFESCMFSTYGAGGYCYLSSADRAPSNPRWAPVAASWTQAPAPSTWSPGSSNWSWHAAPAYANPYYARSYYANPYYSHSYYASSYYANPYYANSYYANSYYAYPSSYYSYPAYANPYPAAPRVAGRWCYTSGLDDGDDCSQPSFEACLFSTRGAGGYCYLDQTYYGAPAGFRLHAARLHVRHHIVRAPEPVVADAAADRKHPGGAGALALAMATEPSGDGGQSIALMNIGADPITAKDPVTAKDPIKSVGLPVLNVEASCRQAAHTSLDAGHDTAVCIEDEHEARDQLVQQWNEFSAADRSSCERTTRATGGGTYTELVTCLDMRRFARGIPQPDPSVMLAGR